jgi:glycosyltransferase involved in cell wall biosynthesis
VKKIHFHSDCPFFAGCENMLAVLLNSDELKSTYNLSFSYRYSAEYVSGYAKRVHSTVPLYPFYFLNISDVSKLPMWIPLLGRRIIMKLIRLIIYWPLMVYEVFVLSRLFHKIKPDILHINNGGYPAALGARAAAIAGKITAIPRIIMVVNNLAVDYKNFSRWADFPVDRLVVKSVDLFITGSLAAANQLQSVLELPDHKITALHNGIPDRLRTEISCETRLRLGLGDFKGVIFGVVAILTPRKGHKVLFDAILNIRKQQINENSSFKVLIEGNGRLRDELVSFVKMNALNDYIQFVGEEKNITDFMASLDVLILPSVADEDFPNVVLEAMALAKPVVATRLAGMPEQVVDGETGFLVKPRNVEELAGAIMELCNNKALRSQMSQAAISKFEEKFTAEISVRNYMALYKSIMESRNI